MTHPRNAPPAGAEAERAAFLHDLRALRDRAGLQPQELAARAHYPEDTLRTAENGPALPTLPVLEAYVRACGVRAAEWEERWRQIMQEPAAPLDLPTRAPTAGRAQTRTAAFSPAGSADQTAIGSGLARVAASLNPALAGSDAGSWFSRPDTAAAGSAAGAPAASAAPAPPAPGTPLSGPSTAGSATAGSATGAPPERETPWRPAENETTWPSSGHGTSWPSGPETGGRRPEHETTWPPPEQETSWRGPQPETTRRPAERETSWRPAEQHETWRSADRETSWRPMASEATWRPPAGAGAGPGTGQPPRPADSPPAAATPPFGPAEPVADPAPPGTPDGRAAGRKTTAAPDASNLPRASGKPARRATVLAVLSVVTILLVAALLWLALTS